MAGLTSSGAEGSSSDDGIGGDGGGKRENEGKITISSVNILFLCSNVGRIYRTHIYVYFNFADIGNTYRQIMQCLMRQLQQKYHRQ